MFKEEVKNKFKIIDEIWESNDEISQDQIYTITDNLAFLINDYNNGIENLNNELNNFQPNDIRAAKQSFYHFREFLSYYYERILSNEVNPIVIGTFTDDLTKIVINK
jgi:hypothetical protein